MVEFELKLRRGGFRLEMEGKIAAPWTVVFGPSGAGKSTLLRLIAGLDRPDSGRIAIQGRYVTDTEIGLALSPGRRSTGMVAQQPALFPHLRVASNIAYGLSQRNVPLTVQRIEEVLDLVDGSHLLRRWPRELSGGEAQRVALARALAPMPRLLLLDEPFSALDGSARDRLLVRLKAWLIDHSIQTIAVTHDLLDALAGDAEVVRLQEGNWIAQGPASVVLAAERSRLLARLTSNPRDAL